MTILCCYNNQLLQMIFIILWFHVDIFVFVLTSVKSMNRNDQHQQDEYPDSFHFVCFQS